MGDSRVGPVVYFSRITALDSSIDVFCKLFIDGLIRSTL